MIRLMTSVPDTHPDVDGDLQEISPELVLVDPELARRLRERELAAIVEEPPPAPVLRLVREAQAPEAAPFPPPSAEGTAEVEVGVEPVAEAAVEDVAANELVDEAATQAETEAVEVADTPALPEAFAPEVPDEPIVPRPIGADTFVMREAEVTPQAEQLPVRARQVFPPRPVPPTRRRGRLLRFVLAVAIVCGAVIAILRFTGASPLSETSVPPSFPVAGESPQASTPPPPAASPPPSAASPPPAVAKPKPATAKPKSSTSRSTSKPKPTAPKKAKTAPTKKPATPPAQPRRFAWAPVTGATGYHVELFRGSDRVYSSDTKQPVLELGQSWRYNGRPMTLTDGTYRWYVWPITAGGRAAQAVVQARLTVP